MITKPNQSTKVVRPFHSVFYGMAIFTGGSTFWLLYSIGLGRFLRVAAIISIAMMSSIFFAWVRHPWAKNMRLSEFNAVQKILFGVYIWVMCDITLFYLLSERHPWALQMLIVDYIFFSAILWACFSPSKKERKSQPPWLRIVSISMIVLSLALFYFLASVIYSIQSFKGAILAIILSIMGIWGVFYLRLDYWVDKYPALRDPDLFFMSPEELQYVSGTGSPTGFFIFVLSLAGTCVWPLTLIKVSFWRALFLIISNFLFLAVFFTMLPGEGPKNFFKKIKTLFFKRK